MIKRSFNIIFMSAGICLLSSCDKQFDLVPEDTYTEKNTISSILTAEGALGDAYIKLYKAYNAEGYTIGDLSTGMSLNFSGVNNSYYTGALDPRDENYNFFWERNYKAINLANVLINKLPSDGKFDDSVKKQFIAEARIIRAFCYSNLLKIYGDGALEGKGSNMCVPLRLVSFDGYDGSQHIPRNTNAEVYTQIFKDIDEAIPDLPDHFSKELATRSRATKGTANALGARVAMYKQDYDKAINYCSKVLANNNYTLAASILDVFADNNNAVGPLPMNSPELIMAFPSSWNNDPTAQNSTYYWDGYLWLSDDFIATYDAKDIRATALLVNGAPWSVHKTPRKHSHPMGLDHLVAIRLAEVVLTMAEALTNKNNVNQDAIDLLNDIHQRSFAPADRPAPFTLADFPGKQQLLDAILTERRWELAAEGFDRFDHIRTGQKTNPVLPANRYPLPIPFREIALTNGVIKQNPGYQN